jgi:hypothetical protein
MYGDSDVELETSESISEYSDISSVSAPTNNDSELGDLLDIPLTYFNIVYFSKDDIINAVDSYHRLSKKHFQLVESDKRRYYVKCADDTCPFKLHFNFRKNNFKAPNIKIPHTCHQQRSHPPSVSFLLNDEDVKSWFDIVKRDATVKDLKNVLSRKGITPEQHIMKKCIQKLKSNYFVDDKEQFKYLDSYVESMILKGHFAVLEKNGENFLRLCILYLEGIQSFGYYYERGMQLDATFIKNACGGTLMVSGFKDGNNNIKIIGIAVVSTENEENWTWFLQNVKDKIGQQPSWIISDRDRGLQNAVQIFNVFHAFCFRHVLENFHLRFKNKCLKEKAWGLAKAKTTIEFNRIAEWMNGINPEAMAWIEEIGLERLAIAFSPPGICRYGTVTSNNVESINSRLRCIRKLPIMEMLINIEEMVALDRFSAARNSVSWNGQLTKYGETVLRKHVKSSETFTCFQLSENIFRITCPGPLQSTNQVDIENGGSCTCGGFKTYKFPCEHMIYVFRQNDINVSDFVCDTWKKDTYCEANRRQGQMGQVTLLENLEKRNTLPPAVQRRRGRPRQRRYQSQAIDRIPQRRIRQNRCRHCREIGHDRRNCPGLT